MKDNEQLVAKKVELICVDCGLPISGAQPTSDVTRYLSETSRCQCNHTAKNESGENGNSAHEAKMAIAVKVCFSVEDANEILSERFEVLSFLGQGGMGSVFKVREKRSDKIFAVKLLNPQLMNDESSLRRFDQEAKAAMHLTHANLAAVYEYGMGKDHNPYLVMDYLDGTTLDAILKKETCLPQGRALDLFIQICDALYYSHFKGVIHRDIKPNNIMVTCPSKDTELAKLFDFGIAKALPNQAIDFTQDMTQTGELFGSPLYMSPEQCKGLNIDERTDIYSLGCVMYKTLCGKHPFEGRNFVDTVVKIITTEATPLSTASIHSKISKPLEQVVMRCLSKNLDYRYRSASALQDDLERVRDGRPIAKVKDPGAPKSFGASNKIAIGGAVVGLICALAAMTMTTQHLINKATPAPAIDTTANAYKDASDFDLKSYTYFVRGEYAKAIPLLQFGIATYKENGKTKMSAGNEDSYLADNYNHIGKCYLMLKQYKEAVPNYRESLRLYQKYGTQSMMPEAVDGYAQVLAALGKQSEADSMRAEFAKLQNLRTIP